MEPTFRIINVRGSSSTNKGQKTSKSDFSHAWRQNELLIQKYYSSFKTPSNIWSFNFVMDHFDWQFSDLVNVNLYLNHMDLPAEY